MEVIENVLADVEPPFGFDWLEIANMNANTNVNPHDGNRTGFYSMNSFWSSAPETKSRPEETNEVLLFTTIARAIVTEVAIKPLKEPSFFHGYGVGTTFSWPKISIQVFDLPNLANGSGGNGPMVIEEDRINQETKGKVRGSSGHATINQRPIINALLSGHKPTYDSPIMEASSTDESWQYYSIPDGVVGNIVVITLWGKTYEQFQHSGYYVCVEKVSVRGVPLII